MHQREEKSNGFTLIELLVVIAILGILATITLLNLSEARHHAKMKRTLLEMREIETALHFYAADHNGKFPADVSRGLPNGIELYLHNPANAGAWPDAPLPGSVYDWDAWNDPSTNEPIYQISVRFCPVGGPLSACTFPKESWATGFGINSAMFFCLQGPCRSHIGEPITYPGYCINC